MQNKLYALLCSPKEERNGIYKPQIEKKITYNIMNIKDDKIHVLVKDNDIKRK